MDYLKLARVLKPQGLKGELKLRPYVDDISRFEYLPHVFIKKASSYEKHEVLSTRTYKDFVYLSISGCNSIEDAEKLRGAFFYIDRENAAPLPEGSNYIADLIGLEVFDGNNVLGTVKDITNTGSADIYSVEGDKNFMFAAAPGVIVDTDLDKGILIVDKKRLEEVAIYD